MIVQKRRLAPLRHGTDDPTQGYTCRGVICRSMREGKGYRSRDSYGMDWTLPVKKHGCPAA